MRTVLVNAKILVTARDEISDDEILEDLTGRLDALQEPSPNRLSCGAGWWVNSGDAVHVSIPIPSAKEQDR